MTASNLYSLPRFGAFCALLLLPLAAPAQEALRGSLAGERAAEAARRALENQPYNLAAEPVRLYADAALGLEYNDNINYYRDALSDFILRPEANARLFWPVTDKNALNVSLGLGYIKYLEHAQYDQFLVSPGSELAFDFFVRDFRFTLFDRFSYTQTSAEVGAVSGVGDYGGFDNTGGLRALWDLNKVILTAEASYYTYLSSLENYAYLDRGTELFLLRAAYLPHANTRVGLEASGSLNSYHDSFLNDGVGGGLGVFLDWRASQYLTLVPRAGYAAYAFDAQPDSLPVDDPSTWYLDFDIRHRLNEWLSHTLEVGHELRLATYSNYEERYYVRHRMDWAFIRDLPFTTFFFYEQGEYPPAGAPQSRFILGDTYDRFGFGLYLRYQLTRKLQTGLTYRLTLKDSEIPVRDYTQNSLTLTATYRF